jgi:prepilin-type N-terminal cleavage/methylation domain-containing protein
MLKLPVANRSRCRRTKNGFTLLEIMVVLGILGVLFGTLFTVYSSTLGISAHVDEAEERGRVVRTTLTLLESDLSGLYLDHQENGNGTERSRAYDLRTGDSAEDTLSGIQERTLIRFATTNTLEFSAHFPKNSVASVRYVLRAKGDEAEPSTLVRLQQRFPGLGSGWTEFELADHVRELTFSFMDDKGVESTEWSEDERKPSENPVMVTALLVLGASGVGGKTGQYSITVPLPGKDQ